MKRQPSNSASMQRHPSQHRLKNTYPAYDDSREDYYPPRKRPTRRDTDWEDRPRPRRKKRRVWPGFLTGCALGIVTAVVAAAIIVFLAINNTLHSSTISLPGGPSLPLIGSTSTFTDPAQQTLTLSFLSQVQIHNQVGDVTVTVDSNATVATVKTTKRVKASSNSSANNEFKRISIDIQPAGTPSGALIVNVTVPNNGSLLGNQNDAVDIAVTLPASLLNNSASPSSTSPPTFTIATSVGNITLSGLSGDLAVKDGVGDVSVDQAQLTNGSRLEAGTGNLTFNGSLVLPTSTGANGTSQPHFWLLSETGNLTVTLPTTTTVILDANTNSGAISSDFNITPSVSAGAANYYGPLNPSNAGQPQAILTVDTSIGAINIHQG